MIKRYDIDYGDIYENDESGEWVRYEDHQKAVDESLHKIMKENHELLIERNRLRGLLWGKQQV